MQNRKLSNIIFLVIILLLTNKFSFIKTTECGILHQTVPKEKELKPLDNRIQFITKPVDLGSFIEISGDTQDNTTENNNETNAHELKEDQKEEISNLKPSHTKNQTQHKREDHANSKSDEKPTQGYKTPKVEKERIRRVNEAKTEIEPEKKSSNKFKPKGKKARKPDTKRRKYKQQPKRINAGKADHE